MTSILFLSHTPRSSTFRVGSHHLSRSFAQSGHRVAHIATPYSIAHAILRPGQRQRSAEARAGVQIIDGVANYIPTPVLPADLIWTPDQTMRALRATGISRPDFVFIDQPLFRAEHFPDSVVVFRPTDLFPKGHITSRAFDVAARTDAIVATSPGVLEAYSRTARGPRHVLENGVEFDLFSQAKGIGKEYDFVYVGAIDDRLDLEVLVEAAERLYPATFAIFGPVRRRLPDHSSNLRFLGAVPYAETPRILSQGRWGIMPFNDTALNAARSPMKLYEYLAAGLQVVAPNTITDRITGLTGAHPFDPSVPDSFVKVLTTLLVTGDSSASEQDMEIAQSMDWSRVASTLLAIAERTTILSRDPKVSWSNVPDSSGE